MRNPRFSKNLGGGTYMDLCVHNRDNLKTQKRKKENEWKQRQYQMKIREIQYMRGVS